LAQEGSLKEAAPLLPPSSLSTPLSAPLSPVQQQHLQVVLASLERKLLDDQQSQMQADAPAAAAVAPPTGLAGSLPLHEAHLQLLSNSLCGQHRLQLMQGGRRRSPAEHLMAAGRARIPPLCIAGPPGTGKTEALAALVLARAAALVQAGQVATLPADLYGPAVLPNGLAPFRVTCTQTAVIVVAAWSNQDVQDIIKRIGLRKHHFFAADAQQAK
jgi:hypothetical protein